MGQNLSCVVGSETSMNFASSQLISVRCIFSLILSHLRRFSNPLSDPDLWISLHWNIWYNMILLFGPGDEDSMFLPDDSTNRRVYTVPKPRISSSSLRENLRPHIFNTTCFADLLAISWYENIDTHFTLLCVRNKEITEETGHPCYGTY